MGACCCLNALLQAAKMFAGALQAWTVPSGPRPAEHPGHSRLAADAAQFQPLFLRR